MISLCTQSPGKPAQASLTLDLAKCEFGKKPLSLTEGGWWRPTDFEVLPITEYPVPSTRRALCRFLAMAGYYSSFSWTFSTVVHLLNNPLSPNLDFEWTPESPIPCRAPVLAAPDLSSSFKLEVDAMELALRFHRWVNATSSKSNAQPLYSSILKCVLGPVLCPL